MGQQPAQVILETTRLDDRAKDVIPFRLQFSLRALLVLMAVVAICLLPVMRERQKIGHEQSIVQRLQMYGAAGYYDWDCSSASSSEPTVAERILGSRVKALVLEGAVSDAALSEISQLEMLEALSIRGREVTDITGRRLALLPRLKRLDLSQTAISNATIESIGSLPRLRVLEIYNTGIDDIGVAKIAELTQLEGLHLSGTRITDRGGVQLSRLHRLMELDLSHTSIGDHTLRSLARLPLLMSLNVSFTDVTDNGLLYFCTF
jgi:hypothetical protein